MKTAKLLAITAVAYFAPTKSVLITVMALSMLDMLLGIAASKRSGKPVSSQGLRRTILKVVLYEIAVLSAYVVGKELVGPQLPVMNMLTTLIGLTELKSVLENLAIISGEGNSVFSNLVTKLNEMSSGTNKSNNQKPPEA